MNSGANSHSAAHRSWCCSTGTGFAVCAVQRAILRYCFRYTACLFHMRNLCVGIAFVFGLSASLHAAVILSENFDELTANLGVTSVGAFSTINGTNVDIVGPGDGFGSLCAAPASGNCVDLDGTGGNPQGQLQSNMTFAPGSYLLSFDLIGSQRGTTASEIGRAHV